MVSEWISMTNTSVNEEFNSGISLHLKTIRTTKNNKKQLKAKVEHSSKRAIAKGCKMFDESIANKMDEKV